MIADTNHRKPWIDISKGIAIMFIVLWHHPWLPQKIFLMLGFSIPVFFFVAGYLFNPDTEFIDLFRRRFNTILRPYLFLMVIITCSLALFKIGPSIAWHLFWIFYANGPNLPKQALHLWFLPSLFLTTLFVWLLFHLFSGLKKSILYQSLVIIVLLVSGFFFLQLFWDVKLPQSITSLFFSGIDNFPSAVLHNNPAYTNTPMLNGNQFILKGLPWSADALLLTAVFFITGFAVKANALEAFFHKGLVAVIFLLIFVVLVLFFNNMIDLNMRRYDHLFASPLAAVSGIYLCTYISNFLAMKNNVLTSVLQYLGRYSLIIYIFHPIIENRVFFYILSIFPNSLPMAIPVAYATGIGIPLAINYLFLERFKLFRFWFYAR